MYSFVARVKPESAYEFFTYTGRKPVESNYRGHTAEIRKGMRFGVRFSRSKKDIRLIFPEHPTRVITLTPQQAEDLAKGAKP